MPIGAIIGGVGAVATAGASLLSGSNQASAQEQAGQDTAQATEYAANLQNQEYQQQLALELPQYNLESAAQATYASALGLPGYAITGTNGQTGQTVTSAQLGALSGGVTGATGSLSSGPSMTSSKSFAGTSEGGLTTQQAQSILSSRPDVASAYAALPAQTQASFGNDPANYAAFWYNKYGQPAGYAIPSAANTGAGSTSGGSLQQANATAQQGILGGSSIPALVEAQPGYQTQLQSGISAIQGAGAVSGSLNSGATLKALDSYGQNTFGNYYNQWLNNVGSLGGKTAATTSQIGSAGSTAATNTGNLAVTGANALGAAGVNAANSWNTAVGGSLGTSNGSSLFGTLSNYAGSPYPGVQDGGYAGGTDLSGLAY